MAIAPQLDYGDVESTTSELTLPMAVIRLDDFRVIAATPSLLTEALIPAGEVVGRPVLELVAPADRGRAKLALSALCGGGIDFIRAYGRLAGASGDQVYTHWLTAVDMGGERMALVETSAGVTRGPSSLARYLGTEPVEVALGAVTREWVTSRVSAGIEGLLGIPAAEFSGRVLLGAIARADVDRVLRAALYTQTELSVGLTIGMRTSHGTWRNVQTVLGSLADSPNRFFILASEPETPDVRAIKLEAHLRRIAGEVQASGILQVPPMAPALANLTSRARLTPKQLEVLSRLVRGERVPTIARELFISQSTVRNHLSTIYDRFGVHSQAELMALAIGDRLSSP